VPTTKTVLVIEDDDDLRRMFRTALAFAGFRVREAADGFQALRAVDVEAPDLILLDLALPLFDGAAVRQELALHPATQYIPVVVVTGSPGTHDELDVVCVLRKPVTPDRVVRTVQSCLERAGAQTASNPSAGVD
jgi:two-component system OmpR family response regulator